MPFPRFRLLFLFLALTAATGNGWAQERVDLPDIGSSAAAIITPKEQAEYGAMTLRELRRLDYVIDDPLLDSYLHSFGYRLVETSNQPEQDFTFFLLRDRNINAFATLGGYVGVNAGLLLAAERESEAAAVLAHEIAHVTQRHILRAVEQARKETPLIALGMLGAVLAAQKAGGDADATQAALASGTALMQQRQINFTRANEAEADRIGIRALARADYDPQAMADFFLRLQQYIRSSGGGTRYYPDYLQTHPVTTSRISEARERAGQIARATTSAAPAPALAAAPVNPLLPGGWLPAARNASDPDDLFLWARERCRVLTEEHPLTQVAAYRDNSAKPTDPAQRDARQYGLALALLRAGQAKEAIGKLAELSERHPRLFWIDLARAEAEHKAGQAAVAEQRYAQLLRDRPSSRAVALSYADALLERGNAESGRRAQDILRPLSAARAEDVSYQRTFARAAELAGDLVRAGEAYAEAAFLSGRPEDALNQLERLKKNTDLNYYQRARIDARITAITPYVLELRRRGVRPGAEDDSPG